MTTGSGSSTRITAGHALSLHASAQAAMVDASPSAASGRSNDPAPYDTACQVIPASVAPAQEILSVVCRILDARHPSCSIMLSTPGFSCWSPTLTQATRPLLGLKPTGVDHYFACPLRRHRMTEVTEFLSPWA